MATRKPKAGPRPGSPVRVFIGEAALVDRHVREAIDAAVPADRQSLDVETVRVPERSLDDAVAALRQVGMFSTDRCVWIKGWPEVVRPPKPDEATAARSEDAGDDGEDDESRTDVAEQVERFLVFLESGLPQGSTLLISAPAFDKRTRGWKRLAGLAEVHDLQPKADKSRKLDRRAMSELVAERLAAAGLRGTRSAVVDAIVERAGTEVGQLLQEVDRLCLVAGEETLDVALVRREMRDMGSAWVFDLTDAVANRNLAEAEAILDRLLSQGEPVQRLVPVIATQIAELIEARRVFATLAPRALEGPAPAVVNKVISELASPWAARRNPWRVYHLLVAARRFGPKELRRLHAELRRLDLATKSSRMPARALLSSFLQQACREAVSAGARR